MNNFRGLFAESDSQTPRLFPGGLSVSRTIGDLFAKDPALGGNPNVTIATPDLHEYVIKPEDSFLVILTDGICDVLSGSEIKSTLNLAMQEARKFRLSVEETVESMACELVKAAYNIMTSTDNLSCVVVSLQSGSRPHK